jgi:hypothetical protein
LPEGRTTVDIDVMEVTPPEVFDLCCYHAPVIAEECGISPKWFDAAPFNLRHMMLAGWRDRTTLIGEFGPLRVRAIARIDLISLKAIASRQRDMEDLLGLAVTHAEAAFVIASLPQIIEQGTNPELVEKAIETMRLFLRPEGGGDEPR